MELIFAILFFAIASVVCVQIFAKAHTMVGDAKDLNYAVNECSSVAETIAVSDSDKTAIDLIAARYESAEADNNKITAYFDKDFAQCSKEEAAYILQTEVSYESRMLSADISVSEAGGDEIYGVSASHHIRREAE